MGVTTARRSAALPDMPAIAESIPGYDSAVWYGVLAPAGTSGEIIARLNREMIRALAAPEVSRFYEAQSYVIDTSTPEQFTVLLRKETEKWGKVIKAAGINPQ